MESGLRHRPSPLPPLAPAFPGLKPIPAGIQPSHAPSLDIDITFPGTHLLQQFPYMSLTFSSPNHPVTTEFLVSSASRPGAPAMRPCPRLHSAPNLMDFQVATPTLASFYSQETPLSVSHTWALASPHCMPKPVTDVDTVSFWPPLSESNSANEGANFTLPPHR